MYIIYPVVFILHTPVFAGPALPSLVRFAIMLPQVIVLLFAVMHGIQASQGGTQVR